MTERKVTGLIGRETVTLIGPPRCLHCNCEQGRCVTSDAADELLDGVTMALQEFDTETLEAIAAYRDRLDPDGWMQRMIRGYIEVWR